MGRRPTKMQNLHGSCTLPQIIIDKKKSRFVVNDTTFRNLLKRFWRFPPSLLFWSLVRKTFSLPLTFDHGSKMVFSKQLVIIFQTYANRRHKLRKNSTHLGNNLSCYVEVLAGNTSHLNKIMNINELKAPHQTKSYTPRTSSYFTPETREACQAGNRPLNRTTTTYCCAPKYSAI